MKKYEDYMKEQPWEAAKKELGIKDGDPINIGWQCSDRLCKTGKKDKVALIWEDANGVKVEKYTYDDIRVLSNGFAKCLKELKVEQADRVFLFMDKIPELYISFLGVLKTGAIVTPLFSQFREESLLTRMLDANASVIFTTKKLAKWIRKIKDQLPNLKHIIITGTELDGLMEGEKAYNMRDKINRVESFEVHPTFYDTPSVLHYTSGTTGKPKGAMHAHGGLLHIYITSKWVLDIKDEDIYWCTADPGWVTGTSYGIIGPWSLGATQYVSEGGFHTAKWYGFIQKYKITNWYSAPTAIRMLMKEGKEIVKQFDLSCLRHLTSVGEPLNPEAVVWSKEVFGKPFHDTFWQTETGGILIANFPGMEIRPGSMGKAFPGLNAVVVDDNYNVINIPGKVGLIALKPNWPSIMRHYWSNTPTYLTKFKKGWYITGDRSSIDKDGYFWFAGRADDIINTAGHLVSPFEVESALLEHPAVAESGAIGKPDPINMEVVKAFVTLKPGFTGSVDLELEIINFVRKKLSALAMPQSIEFIDKLPKTRSGKIMRRVLKCRETGEPVGDLSTLEND